MPVARAGIKACVFQRHFAGGGATEALDSPPFGGVWGNAPTVQLIKKGERGSPLQALFLQFINQIKFHQTRVNYIKIYIAKFNSS